LHFFGSAALKRSQHFVMDGETIVLGVDGISDFEAISEPT
jgi:hypothetical protein